MGGAAGANKPTDQPPFLTFKEYIPTSTRPLSLEAPRSKLREVRWLDFLRGRAYTNPFHDLLYALSRSSPAPERPPDTATPAARSVEFGEQQLTIRAADGTETSYPYEQLIALKLDYTNVLTYTEMRALELMYLRLDLATAELDMRIDLHASHDRAVKLCHMLLDLGVNFKEYHLGSRSFLLETNIPYRRIQELKAEYGLEW